MDDENLENITQTNYLFALIAQLQHNINTVQEKLLELQSSVDSTLHIVGDGDVSQESGYIEIDKDAPSHPVVRFRADKLPSGSGGKDYVSGVNSNLVFTPSSEDPNIVTVDVYYI